VKGNVICGLQHVSPSLCVRPISNIFNAALGKNVRSVLGGLAWKLKYLIEPRFRKFCLEKPVQRQGPPCFSIYHVCDITGWGWIARWTVKRDFIRNSRNFEIIGWKFSLDENEFWKSPLHRKDFINIQTQPKTSKAFSYVGNGGSDSWSKMVPFRVISNRKADATKSFM